MSENLEELYEYYRKGENQFRIAGGTEGCMKLANDFYDAMETLPEARNILKLHPSDLTVPREKLGRFLCGYLNGPELYEEKYGPIQLAPAHAHIPIGTAEKDAWLQCMETALGLQPYPREFKDFILKRLAIPAERCRNQA